MVERFGVGRNLAFYVKRCNYSECRILSCYVRLLGGYVSEMKREVSGLWLGVEPGAILG